MGEGEFFNQFGAAAGFVKTLAHGIVGGLSQELGGGDFLSGFLSAGFVQGFGQIGGFKALGITDAPADVGDYVQNAVVTAVIGGTASVLGGGKFKNGAITGAFSRLFNDVAGKISFDAKLQRNMQVLRDAGYGGIIDNFDKLGVSIEYAIMGENVFDPKTNTIYWNPDYDLLIPVQGIEVPVAALLLHEIDHAMRYYGDPGYRNLGIVEREVIVLKGLEADYLRQLGLNTRSDFYRHHRTDFVKYRKVEY